MKRRTGEKLGWLRRPQLWALAIACGMAAGGFWLSVWLPVKADPQPTVRVVKKVLAESLPSPSAARVNTIDCLAQPCLALTFDDGPLPEYTPYILDVLQRNHVRATFFVVGSNAARYPELVKREYREGHEVGNHSWGHPDFTTLTPEQMRAEIANTQQAVVDAGVPAPTVFRPPYGAINDAVVANVPLTIIKWNIDPEDWRQGPHNIIAHMDGYAKRGGLIVMHDTELTTAEALESMLHRLQSTYQFVTVSELLSLPSGQRGIFYGR
jgi:peptidoglycan-N-acetylglucosamine deacetylase